MKSSHRLEFLPLGLVGTALTPSLVIKRSSTQLVTPAQGTAWAAAFTPERGGSGSPHRA